ncbi:hypothetical protein GQ44DRAFT_40718 [Phaeosphaeriaceae sp. PMI808]|nr:hypothetical protein GQ44DRAFT_40718 [Phaeosphaeriaceae sp. PMI808]
MPSFDLSLREEDIGVIPPPPGVAPNFINPPSLQHIILITNITLPFFSMLFVILRIYTTGFIIHSVGIDDYMIALAWVSCQSIFTCYCLNLCCF